MYKPVLNRIRDIDVNPPEIFGENTDRLFRIRPGLYTDSQRHNNHRIAYAEYSEYLNRIIALDSLS